MKNMTTRYRLITRSNRSGKFYCVDKTTDKDSAQQMVDAKNQAERQPALNYQIAKAYLAGTDKA